MKARRRPLERRPAAFAGPDQSLDVLGSDQPMPLILTRRLGVKRGVPR